MNVDQARRIVAGASTDRVQEVVLDMEDMAKDWALDVPEEENSPLLAAALATLIQHGRDAGIFDSLHAAPLIHPEKDLLRALAGEEEGGDPQ